MLIYFSQYLDLMVALLQNYHLFQSAGFKAYLIEIYLATITLIVHSSFYTFFVQCLFVRYVYPFFLVIPNLTFSFILKSFRIFKNFLALLHHVQLKNNHKVLLVEENSQCFFNLSSILNKNKFFFSQILMKFFHQSSLINFRMFSNLIINAIFILFPKICSKVEIVKTY